MMREQIEEHIRKILSETKLDPDEMEQCKLTSKRLWRRLGGLSPNVAAASLQLTYGYLIEALTAEASKGHGNAPPKSDS